MFISLINKKLEMVKVMKQTNNLHNDIIYFVYQKAFIQSFHTSLLITK